MRNRFAARIKSGEIATESALKTEFRNLAKAHHPDLRGPGAEDGDFVRLRAEYEAALRDFDRHRFGFRPPEAIRPSRGDSSFDREGLCLTLAALLKRGFPKTPRHEKEKTRYGHCRSLALAQLEACGPGKRELFEAFERDLSAAREEDPRAFRAAISLLKDIIGQRAAPLSQLETANAISLALVSRASGGEGAVPSFFRFLMGREAVSPTAS